MHVVVFELWPAEGRREDYLAIAAALRADLRKMPGFLSVERFESLSEPGKLLSLSFWESEEAIANWRRQMAHREAQAKGRAGIFREYRLRVAEVVRDYTLSERREEAPADSREVHGA
jgi:heme-degrading monooxygenase HmoA